jgi:hypothetical protein
VTANLTALRAAAASGDRCAMLLLADLLEEAGDDARAGCWRWLADPRGQGWERRAWEVLTASGWRRGDVPDGRVFADAAGGGTLLIVLPASAAAAAARHRWYERRYGGGRWTAGGRRVVPGPWVRDACLSACRLALAGASGGRGLSPRIPPPGVPRPVIVTGGRHDVGPGGGPAVGRRG